MENESETMESECEKVESESEKMESEKVESESENMESESEKMERKKLKKWKVKGSKCEGLPTQLAGKNKNFFSFCVLESFVVVSSDIRDYFTSGWFIFVVTQS